ncbi:hypothetical protein LTR64_007397 [Lithohypha guttulata]|uniref:uncharacterized protein n=1 Tax=Lithohypha guttulata TaxID=1690604 RepID=UPI00315D96E7
MAQWYTFVGSNEYDPEILVGMYDQWLSRLDFGPTQAERVLVHTPMMDLAHERRFVISETGQDFSNFEAEHCHCVQSTIERLQNFYSGYSSYNKDDTEFVADRDLVGLAPQRQEECYTTPLAPQVSLKVNVDLAEQESHPSMSWPATLQDSTRQTSTAAREPDFIAADETDIDDDMVEQWLEAARRAGRHSRRTSHKQPRQFVPTKLRRSLRPVSKLHGSQHSVPTVKTEQRQM